MALEKIEYHAEKETEQLIRLFAPAIEDADRISQVDVRMEAYIKDRFFNVLSQKDPGMILFFCLSAVAKKTAAAVSEATVPSYMRETGKM